MDKELNIDKTTCWYKKQHYVHVNNFIKREGKLTNTKHGKILEKLINFIPEKEEKFLDIGCGGCRASEIIGKRKYTGVDLPEIIEKLAKIRFPKVSTIKCDFFEDDIDFINDFDIVMMNGIIDIMQYPLETLDRILNKSKKYVVLHRINIHEGETFTELGKAYDGTTYLSIINEEEFLKVLKKYNFKIIKKISSGFTKTYKSFILKKK